MNQTNLDFIEAQLLDEIPVFQSFLYKIGFKRIEGAIYGLLVLAKRPLASEEIEAVLGLSQSAVSQGLKRLAHFGAVETLVTGGRSKIHQAKADSLTTVATVFRKREQEAIGEFKRMAQRAKSQIEKRETATTRLIRLDSIIMTCMAAEAVMNFVFEVVTQDLQTKYPEVMQRFIRTLDILSKGTAPIKEVTDEWRNKLTSSIKQGLGKFVGEAYERGQQLKQDVIQ